MAVVAGDLIDVGRALFAAISSLTGVRSSGTIRVNPTAGATTILSGNYLIAEVNGALRHDLLFKIPPLADGTMTRAIAGGGSDIPIVSNVGGIRHNLPAGTVLRFDPPLAGVATTAEVNAPGLAGGLEPEGLLAVRDVAQLETLTGPMTGLEFFRSTLRGVFPAVLAQWADSEPADGLATSTLSRGESRVGEGRQLYSETFVVSIVVSREDSESMRRAQGLRIMDEVTDLLTDRQIVDGVVISYPSGLQIRRRGALSGLAREVYQAFQIYQIEFALTRGFDRRDARTFEDLLRFKLDAPKDDTPDKELVQNVLIANPQS